MSDSGISTHNGDFMKTSGNETIARYENAIVIRFPGKRNCVSTSWLNGGYREDLTAVFNHQIPLNACEACHLPGGNVKTYLEEVACSLSLDPKTASGLMTRADMRNAAFVAESFRDLSVSAIVTGGIDVNGGRAGDPAAYYETDGHCEPVGGTINIILIINADLPEYAIMKAFMTATEAKAAALQQVMARSRYSTGIATGSGTDMIAIIVDPTAKLRISNAGKHSKLGEMIGRSVIRATLLALELETGLSPKSQRDMLVRLSRFFVTDEDLWNTTMARYRELMPETISKEKFMRCLREKAQEPALVTLISAILHIIDEVEWGLLPKNEAKKVACQLIIKGLDLEEIPWEDKESCFEQESILQYLNKAISEFIIREIHFNIPK
jgi:adenosylcobinamide hydrolase